MLIDRPTNRPTDIVTYRAAITAKNIELKTIIHRAKMCGYAVVVSKYWIRIFMNYVLKSCEKLFLPWSCGFQYFVSVSVSMKQLFEQYWLYWYWYWYCCIVLWCIIPNVMAMLVEQCLSYSLPSSRIFIKRIIQEII